MNFIINGTDFLAAHPGFKLVGRAADLERLTSVLMRKRSSSIILVGPGGVGSTALCMGLQAAKNDPNAAFDIVSKRLFWLETDGLFSSGSTDTITEHFNRIVAVLKRTPDSVLIIEDARDFIDAARANGLGNFINSLNNLVKRGETQIILETRDEDLDVVFKAHSDMRERYTLIDLAEPMREALREIVVNSAADLSAHHGIRITDEAIDVAIELTTKYRTRDAGLSRAQPERTMTLLDRAISTYRLNAHKRHPDMEGLLARLGDKASTPEGEAQIAALNAEFAEHQKEIKRLHAIQREGEGAILDLEAQITDVQKREKERVEGGDNAPQDQQRGLKTLAALTRKGNFDSGEVVSLREKIRSFQIEVSANRQKFDALANAFNCKLAVTRDIVVEQFSLISGISASKLNLDERKKLRLLEPNMRERVFGQDEPIRRLANAIKIAKVGKRLKSAPLASFLFMGPSGVGKTELAKVLTRELLDDENALTRFDMSEYMEKHAVAKLIGAPPGYEGFEAGGILTNAMRRNPVRVLLFDEIEKAHPDVFNLFLQILSDSRLTDNVGRVVSFDDAVIIMTTNIGQKYFLDASLSDDEAERLANEELQQIYRAEFLNRFEGRQNIVCFNRLGQGDIARIVRREVTVINSRYVDTGLTLDVPDAVVAEFCEDQYDPTTGARGPVGYVKSRLEPILANLALDHPDFAGAVVVRYDTATRTFDTTAVAHPTSNQELLDETQRSAA